MVKTSSVNDRRFYKDLVVDGYIERWVQPPWVHIKDLVADGYIERWVQPPWIHIYAKVL